MDWPLGLTPIEPMSTYERHEGEEEHFTNLKKMIKSFKNGIREIKTCRRKRCEKWRRKR